MDKQDLLRKIELAETMEKIWEDDTYRYLRLLQQYAKDILSITRENSQMKLEIEELKKSKKN
ncbi:MAG: hypothetical protein ACI86H_002407 [bacterium]|jgi:hypothetical protein